MDQLLAFCPLCFLSSTLSFHGKTFPGADHFQITHGWSVKTTLFICRGSGLLSVPPECQGQHHTHSTLCCFFKSSLCIGFHFPFLHPHFASLSCTVLFLVARFGKTSCLFLLGDIGLTRGYNFLSVLLGFWFLARALCAMFRLTMDSCTGSKWQARMGGPTACSRPRAQLAGQTLCRLIMLKDFGTLACTLVPLIQACPFPGVSPDMLF